MDAELRADTRSASRTTAQSCLGLPSGWDYRRAPPRPAPAAILDEWSGLVLARIMVIVS